MSATEVDPHTASEHESSYHTPLPDSDTGSGSFFTDEGRPRERSVKKIHSVIFFVTFVLYDDNQALRRYR